MKLFKPTEDERFYIPIYKRKRILLASSVLIISLYVAAMICSLCGVNYFINTYQNEQMDSIQNFFVSHKIYPLLTWIFETIGFAIVYWFINKKAPKRYFILAHYALPVGVSALGLGLPSIFYTFFSVFLLLLFTFLRILIENKRVIWKEFGFCCLRYLLVLAITYVLQVIIFTIKAGYFQFAKLSMNLSDYIVYSLEYDIALFVLLLTIKVFIEEKEGIVWTTWAAHGGFSQISKKKSQKSKRKTLNQKTKRKLAWLYVRLWVTQLGGFLLVMILPFVFGKVLEFLIMYLCFCVVRYILGFKYSLHYKRETVCITTGVVVFGFLTLIVPSFQTDLVIGVLLGISLAILLHLSYRLKTANLFLIKVSRDRFAELYVVFNGRTEPEYINKMALHYGVDKDKINILIDYLNGEKLSYLSYKYNYSLRQINNILDEITDKVTKEV